MPDNIEYAAGGITTYFSRLETNPQGTRRTLTDITSIGVDGVAVRKEELRAPEFGGESLVYTDTANNAGLIRQIYEGLVGKLVTIEHQGVDFQNIMVLDVAVSLHRPVVKAFFVILQDGTTSTGTGFEVRATWRFRYGGTP